MQIQMMWLCSVCGSKTKIHDDISVHFLHTVPHICQEKSYDCGLACLKMVLSWCLQDSFKLADFADLIGQQGFDNNIWTIDLAYLLHLYDIQFSFYTTVLGVDSSYKTNPYYSQNFSKEEKRVSLMFSKCQDLGLPIAKREITLEEIIRHLKSMQAIIVLVSASMLNCKICYGKVYKFYLSLTKKHYRGHYIVLVGCIEASKEILYRDPAFASKLCIMSFETLEAARCCVGTDQDLILVYSGKPQKL